MAVGYDNIDVLAITRRGVLVANTPDVLTETTADIAWALLTATARRVVEGQQDDGSRPMGRVASLLHARPRRIWRDPRHRRRGTDRRSVARRAKAFNMRVLYHNRRRAPQLEVALGAEYRAFDDLLQESDFVVMTVPLTNKTRGLFGAREFALMKDTAVFVNIARGGVVKEADWVEALRRGRPWAAGLDVFEIEPTPRDNPLFACPTSSARHTSVAPRHARAQRWPCWPRRTWSTCSPVSRRSLPSTSTRYRKARMYRINTDRRAE